MEPLQLNAALSALVGGSLVAGVAKYFISRTLDKIEEMPEKLSEIKAQLSSMQTKLDGLEKIHSMVTDHDRKLVAIEAGRRSGTRRNQENYKS